MGESIAAIIAILLIGLVIILAARWLRSDEYTITDITELVPPSEVDKESYEKMVNYRMDVVKDMMSSIMAIFMAEEMAPDELKKHCQSSISYDESTDTTLLNFYWDFMSVVVAFDWSRNRITSCSSILARDKDGQVIYVNTRPVSIKRKKGLYNYKRIIKQVASLANAVTVIDE